MSFSVRIFGLRGVNPPPIIEPKQATVETVYALTWPYVFAETLTAGAVAVSSTANTDARTQILRIEIPDGSAIRFEVNTPNRAVDASASSPILTGNNQILWGTSWTLSIIEA